MKDMTYKPPKVDNKQTILAIVMGILIILITQVLAIVIGNVFVAIGLPVAIGNLIAGILYPVLMLLSVSLLCKKVLKLSLESCKITKFHLKPVWCIVALIIPILVSIMFIFTPGHFVKPSLNSSAIWATLTYGVILTGLATGIVEEVIFRGVIMSVLEYRFNKWIAIICPSVIFGLVHMIGNDLDFISVLLLVIAGSGIGILFSLVTYESGSIWCSALLHGVWNIIIIGGILHIGTTSDQSAIYNYVLESKSYIITGGDFGIESSIISIGVYAVFITFTLFLMKRNGKKR